MSTPETQTTALATKAAAATVELSPRSGEIVRVGFDTLQGFEALQRIAKAFAASDLVPQQYRGNFANCVIAVEMATRIGASPLMAMQNLYVVHGRPAWSSQFLISAFNSCGRFGPVRYRFSGEKGKDSWGCVAYARELASGDVLEGPEVSIAMAKAEGWYGKNGSKWQTIPQLMLQYRAATFFIRTTAPEITMGLRTADEAEDIGELPSAAALPAGPVASTSTQRGGDTASEVERALTGATSAIPAGTVVTADGLAAAGGDPTRAAQRAALDDVAFETAEEEQLRLAREQQAAREKASPAKGAKPPPPPAQDGGDFK